MRSRTSPQLLVATAATVLIAALLATVTPSARAGGQSLSQLDQQLGATQATEANLQADLAQLNGQISGLQHQIALLSSREQEVQRTLRIEEAQLRTTSARLQLARTRLSVLRHRLHRAQTILAAQLVSRYEQPSQNLMSVVLETHGFSQLLDRLQFLQDAERSQQQLITVTTRAKRAATTAATQLATVQHRQTQAANAAALEAGALQNMQALANARQSALAHIETARRAALDNARARGARLRGAIDTIRAEQAAAAAAAARAAAAAQAAAARAAASTAPTPTPGAVATASGGWAIPAAVVMCESGGQNLPPNSAGASGYYQILPSTWTGEGGSGPAAYLAPKSEQDAIAAKLWAGGAGAHNWVCAGLVGIS